MYFSDRLYSNEELPSDYRMKGRRTESSINTTMAYMSSLVLGGSGDQGHRKGLNKPRIDIALQTTAAGEEYIRGFHTILYSIGWSPLKYWKKDVSVRETTNASLLPFISNPPYCLGYFDYEQFVLLIKR